MSNLVVVFLNCMATNFSSKLSVCPNLRILRSWLFCIDKVLKYWKKKCKFLWICFYEFKRLSTLKIFGPDYDRALRWLVKGVTIKVSKNSLNCITRTVRAMCLIYILCITMSLMITCAFTTSRYYACKSKWFFEFYKLWNESLYRIIPCYVLCINSLLSLGRRQTCLWSSRPKGNISFRRGVGSPLSIAREYVIYKTPHDGVYVCDMSPPLIWFIWPPCNRSCK